MSCSICPSDDGHYVIIRVDGNITRLKSLEWITQAHALGRKLKIDRFLLDLRQSRNLESNAEGYRLAYSDIPRLENINMSAKVAVLVAPGDESHNFDRSHRSRRGAGRNHFQQSGPGAEAFS